MTLETITKIRNAVLWLPQVLFSVVEYVLRRAYRILVIAGTVMFSMGFAKWMAVPALGWVWAGMITVTTGCVMCIMHHNGAADDGT